MSTYSTLFFSGEGVGGSQLVYTVPALSVVVLRDIEVWNNTTGPAALSVSRYVSGSFVCVVVLTPAIESNVWWQWQGRAVFNPGDEIYISAPPQMFAHISGYLLSS